MEGEDELSSNDVDEPESELENHTELKERRSFLDKLTERVKDFLDNAE